MDHRDPAAASMGFLPELTYFYQHLSARELLVFMGELTGVSGPGVRGKVEKLLERVDLVRFAGVPLSKYSRHAAAGRTVSGAAP